MSYRLQVLCVVVKYKSPSLYLVHFPGNAYSQSLSESLSLKAL